MVGVAASPVVLVSGVAQSAGTWSRWVDDLAAAGVPHAIAEVRHAGFAKRAAYLDAIDGARTAMLEAAGLPSTTPTSIVGFSAGGVGAVDYLRRNPDLVDRVVTVSSPLRGNWLATGAATALGPVAPPWVRDLSAWRAVGRGLDPELARRVTSIVGAEFDGIVTARSGAVDGIRTLRLGGRFHPRMQEANDEVRRAALELLAA